MALTMHLTVPKGMSGREQMHIQTPSGVMMVTIPHGLQAGASFLCVIPRVQKNSMLGSGVSFKNRAVLSAFSVIAVLMAENFMIWVVSATFESSHSEPYPDPLQDNLQIIFDKTIELAQLNHTALVVLRNSFDAQWALISAALVGILGACELKLGRAANRNMWLLSMRALLTFSCVRIVRTVSFLLTVLPSQKRDCYQARFPYPVPQNWSDWILTGMKPAHKGGCNDLIVSGHATVMSVVACICTSVADNTMFSLAAWSLLAFDCVMEVYEGFHYSVDMWLGVVLTCLIFHSFAVLEKEGDETAHKQVRTMPSNYLLTALPYRSVGVIRRHSPTLLGSQCESYGTVLRYHDDSWDIQGEPVAVESKVT